MPDPTIILTCNRCQTAKLPLFMDLAGLDASEHWGAATEPAKAAGWAVRRDLTKIEAICPACLKAEAEQPTAVLAPYSGESACPKCCERWIKTRFCTGQQIGCPVVIRRDHMHRTCETCGFDWIEATADTPTETRTWKQRIFGKTPAN